MTLSCAKFRVVSLQASLKHGTWRCAREGVPVDKSLTGTPRRSTMVGAIDRSQVGGGLGLPTTFS